VLAVAARSRGAGKAPGEELCAKCCWLCGRKVVLLGWLIARQWWWWATIGER